MKESIRLLSARRRDKFQGVRQTGALISSKTRLCDEFQSRIWRYHQPQFSLICQQITKMKITSPLEKLMLPSLAVRVNRWGFVRSCYSSTWFSSARSSSTQQIRATMRISGGRNSWENVVKTYPPSTDGFNTHQFLPLVDPFAGLHDVFVAVFLTQDFTCYSLLKGV